MFCQSSISPTVRRACAPPPGSTSHRAGCSAPGPLCAWHSSAGCSREVPLPLKPTSLSMLIALVLGGLNNKGADRRAMHAQNERADCTRPPHDREANRCLNSVGQNSTTGMVDRRHRERRSLVRCVQSRLIGLIATAPSLEEIQRLESMG